jgi:demethylmenaquinone methyltransferase/2-methoxy-6-polyprenyl-1,4-benzoquinol methylase
MDRKGRAVPNQEKALAVRGMFARIVGRYQPMNTLMTGGLDRYWRRVTVMMARPRGARVLDVATGTGQMAQEAIRQGAQQVVGIDFCPAMLEAAANQIRSRPPSSPIALVLGDALHLPCPDDSFDCVVSAFLLRNVADLNATFAEMMRVARPEGRVVCLEITHPRGLFSFLFRPYFSLAVPFLGRIIARDPAAYHYLVGSLATFPDADGLAQVMRRAGLVDVRYRLLTRGAVAVHLGTKPAPGQISRATALGSAPSPPR